MRGPIGLGIGIGLAIVGIIVVVAAGILGWVVVPSIIEDKIEEEVRLVNNSDTWDKWKDIPFDVYLIFYVHNVSNPDEVEAGETPKYTEAGPYAYRQQRRRINLSQDDEENPENSVQYQDEKTYWFDENMSEGNKESDLVNVINIPFVSVVHVANKRLGPFIAQLIANNILENETLIRRDVKVGELLFQGFDVSNYVDNPILGPQLPEEFEGKRFGLYKGENATASLRFNIHTGVDDSKVFGKIITYNGSSTLGYWKKDTPCDELIGTDGTVFPPFFDKDRKIDVFVTDLCRSLRLEFQEEVKVKGIKAYRYTVPKYVLEDPRINEDNMCYCLTDKPEDCPKAAAMSMAGCRNGAPVTMSTPYFLDGDQGYIDDSGLDNPDREKHFTFLDLEPNTGVLLNGKKRIQVNIEFTRVSGVNAYKNQQKDFLFPLVWVEESGMIDDKSADELKSKLLKPLKLVDILRWVFVAIGVAVFIAGIILIYVKGRKSKTTV